MPSLTTVQAAATLSSILYNLSLEARQSAQDESTSGYGPDITQALNRMQLDSVGLISTYAQVNAFNALARYYALVRLAARLATQVDRHGYAEEGERDDIFRATMELRRVAAREAALYGYPVEATSETLIGGGSGPIASASPWNRLVFPTDYIEPDPVPYYPLDL